MGAYSERLNALSVNAMSPDGTVRVKLTREGGIKVSLEDHLAERHSESSLSEEIERAIDGAFDGYDRAVSAINADFQGTKTTSPEMTPTGRKKAFIEAVNAIHLRAVSPREFVSVDWQGQLGIVLLIEGGALNQLDRQGLESEINTPIGALATVRTRRIWALHRAIYQPKHFISNRKDRT